MATELKPIRTKADHKNALAEVERLWGAKSGTPKGDRLDVLATLIDAYEARHYPRRVRAVSKPLASAASTVPISLPR
jgi:antitoxin component HigA of HigAB toxin-antitoxin module